MGAESTIIATHVHILYFAFLPDQLGTASEDLAWPGGVNNVRYLPRCAYAAGRGKPGSTEDKVKITVNRQFADMDGVLTDASEVAIVSARPF